MPLPTDPPEQDLRRVADAEIRMLGAIAPLTDADVARPSLLPGWTVGHVLTHVARNAESHIRRAEAAMRGEIIDQYEGGFEGRAADIDRGAERSAREIIDDVRRTAGVLQTTWADVPLPAWGNITRDVGGRERPFRALPERRWQELEVHVVDLGIGITYRDWPDDFVAAGLARMRAEVRSRLTNGARLPVPGTLDERDELAWMYGRLVRDDLPALVPWS